MLLWNGARLSHRLAGPPLMCHVDIDDATHYVRRFLTALLGIPLATKGMEEEDVQGTLTLWFHENKDTDGNPSDKVYGVSNCHVLRKDTTVEYEHRAGAPKNHVRVCGMRRFQRGLNEIRKVIDGHGICVDLWAREIVELEAKERQDVKNAKAIRTFDATWKMGTRLSPISRPCTTKSRNPGPTLSSTATLATSNTLQPSRPTSKAAHCIPQTGLRSWPLRRRSRMSSRATLLISVRFDSSYIYLV